jgi:hypothetical protein
MVEGELSSASRRSAIADAETAAFFAGDAGQAVAYMTDDVLIRPPGFLLGQRELRGHEQARAFVEEFKTTLPLDRKVELTRRRHFLDRADESRLLVIDELTVSPEDASERPQLGTFTTEVAVLFTFTDDDRICRLESWATEKEGRAQLAEPAPVRSPGG